MKYSIYLSFLVAFTAAVVLFTSCSKDKQEDPNSPSFKIKQSEQLVIPSAVELPFNAGGNLRVATYYAEGVQKYKAQAKAGGGYEWVLVAPKADLYNSSNQKVGTHTAGPTWQLYGAADSMFAQAFSPARTAASSQPATIDWLLLQTKTGKTPTGIFAGVEYVQRIDTRAGKAPAVAPLALTDTADVPYTAVYRFSKRKI